MAMKGNSCLLFLQRISTILLCIVSLCFLAIGIYLTVLTQNPGLFEMVFMILGIAEISMGFYVICKSKSRAAMTCFIWIMSILVGFQFVASIIAYFFKDEILEWAAEKHSTDQKAADEFRQLIEQNVTIALYSAIAASVIQVISDTILSN